MSRKFAFTISREYGSGGRKIGKLLAEKLKIPFYDNEIISEAAINSGFTEKMFEDMEERAGVGFLYTLSNLLTYDSRGIRPYDQLFDAQCKVIHDNFKKSSCVFVGRCADYALRNEEDVYNIFICSDLKDKVKSIKAMINKNEREENCKSDEQVKYIIERIDKNRATYYNHYTNWVWGKASEYDLCINTTKIRDTQAVDIIYSLINK